MNERMRKRRCFADKELDLVMFERERQAEMVKQRQTGIQQLPPSSAIDVSKSRLMLGNSSPRDFLHRIFPAHNPNVLELVWQGCGGSLEKTIEIVARGLKTNLPQLSPPQPACPQAVTGILPVYFANSQACFPLKSSSSEVTGAGIRHPAFNLPSSYFPHMNSVAALMPKASASSTLSSAKSDDVRLAGSPSQEESIRRPSKDTSHSSAWNLTRDLLQRRSAFTCVSSDNGKLTDSDMYESCDSATTSPRSLTDSFSEDNGDNNYNNKVFNPSSSSSVNSSNRQDTCKGSVVKSPLKFSVASIIGK